MDVVETKLKPPENFKFPFTPYDIQNDFMRNLYEALEGKKLGIFESPTGTGKSMSLICGSLAWLLDHDERMKNDINRELFALEESIKKLSTDDNWLQAHEAQAKDKQKRDHLRDYLNKIIKKEKKLDDLRSDAENLKDKQKHKAFKFKSVKNGKRSSNRSSDKENENETVSKRDEEVVIEDDILLDDDLISVSDKLDKSESDDDDDDDKEDEEEFYGVKIYFCSRTHSQLSQIVHEIKKSPYNNMKLSVVSLSSRQNYCINENVLRLKHLHLINERCQDLHSKEMGKITKMSDNGERLKKQKVSSSCLFYQQSNIADVKLKILTEISDIENVVTTGKEFRGCPYYASRSAVPDAHIILVPYNTILHRSTRLACGIDLKDSVVIIDEAHNLLDAIANIHSSIVSGYQLVCSHSQLIQYRDKFHDKFSPYNLLRLNQMIYIVKNLIRRLGGKTNAKPDDAADGENNTTVETITDFAHACEIDNINLYDILEFSKRSRITRKLHGFTLRYNPTVVIRNKRETKGVSSFLKSFGDGVEDIPGDPENEDRIEGNPLVPVLGFIESLTDHHGHGRIVCNKNKTIRDSFIKYLLLNPASHFTDIVNEARSVVLAGGTMEPISEFTDQLFTMAGADPGRIKIFTCGHVVRPDNILPIIVNSGPTGKMFDFSYQSRNDAELIEELGRLLINVCSVVPSGVVCFFPSYEYENFVYNRLLGSNVIPKLELKKRVLREPKKSSRVDEVLREYAKSAREGALLLSVVGGKLSEGLNFNDELGRCILVVGLPYPNSTNPELKEKMNYLSETVSATTNNIVLSGAFKLWKSLTHFVWVVTMELLKVTELFVDQCEDRPDKKDSGNSVPVLKPVPVPEVNKSEAENKEGTEENVAGSKNATPITVIPIDELYQMVKDALPNTRVKLLKIPFQNTWRQNISEGSV